MKKTKLKLVLLMTVSMGFLFSCQPKDVAVARPGSTNANGQATASMTSTDYDKMLALSIDRQFEALHIVKSVLNPAYATAHSLQSAVDTNGKVNKLKPTKGPQIVKAEDYNGAYYINYDVQALEFDADGKLSLLILKNVLGSVAESKAVLIRGTTQTDISNKGVNEYIVVKPTTNVGEYSLSVDRYDEMNSKAERQNFFIVSGSSTLTWDGLVASLDQALPMKLTTLNIDRKGYKVGNMKFDSIVSNNLTLTLGDCASVTGNITLTQKIAGKTPRTIISDFSYIDSSSSMSDGRYSYKARDCASRPVIDYAKLL